MASSSSNPQWIYDVFINFRGEDTRHNFVSHLHTALSKESIQTFVDYDLHKGKDVAPELLRAIEGSQISIVIFSEKYAESSWCLDELVKIMECRRTYGQVVIPIFYHVDPGIVRRQKGAFGKALEATAKKRCSDGANLKMQDVLSRWRSALTEAAHISGWDAGSIRNDDELVTLIVEDVFKIRGNTLSITEFPVGLESRVEQVLEFIGNRSSEVCMIGIWGMGGSGKTTLAKAIYNRILRHFADRGFIENIREVCEKDNRGIVHLQQQLLSDILKTKEKIHGIALGTTMIQKRLRGKRALVILDGVTTFEQLDALCVNRIWFDSGSVLIVTTRDVRLLNELKVDYVYTMKEMDEIKSIELFSWHAFRAPIPREDFIELSTDVVDYCGGLPLALKVLGSYLHERTKPEWKSLLSKLERIPNDQVQEKLRISYDGLKDNTEKDIFLDICCFFIGKDRAYVTKILNACRLYANIGIVRLIEQGLLKVDQNNKLQMHHLLRDMGREIVCQSSVKKLGKRSRLWCHEDVQDVLTNNTGTETVEGLVLNLQGTRRVCFSTSSFKEMKKLRLLQLDCVDLTGDFGYLSKQLRWVKWQGFALECIPDDFYLENLVVIDLKHSNIKQVWRETKLLENLKILNLSHSKYLKSTPDFSKLPNLERLIMKDCPSLFEVHPSIGDLSKILLINLKDCTNLRNLPRKIYQLKSLKTLILSGCSKIDKLEEDIVQMESLTTLIAKNTAVKEVPYSIVTSKSIAYISLCGYEGLSHDIFPSLIRSWISPTMNSLPHISPFGGMSLSLVSLDAESHNLSLGYLSPMISSLSKLRSVRVQCHSETQLTQELRRFVDDLYDANYNELETSHASQIPDLSLRSLLIGMGNYHIVIDTLGKSISQGCKIHATVRRQLLYKFEKELKEGSVYHITNLEPAANGGDYRTTRHAYKLKFLFGTKVKLANSDAVPPYVFSFTPPANVFKNDFQSEFLVDVIGLLTTYTTEREIQHNGKKSKMIEISLLSDSFHFKCTLFGIYADEFNSFIASGDKDNAVIAVLFAKVKTFQGKPVLQNTYSTTKLLFNPECSEAAELRKQIVGRDDSPCQGLSPLEDHGRVSLAEELLTLTPTTTIEGLKECKEGSMFVIEGTVKFVDDEENWWYTACKCNKKVYADSGMYFCEKCNTHVVNVTPRFRIKVRVVDETGSTTFVLFDREASLLLKKSCAQLIESSVMNSASSSVPKEISSLIDQTMLFKVEINTNPGSRYETSYRVKRVSNDAEILRQYRDVGRLQPPVVADLSSPENVCSLNGVAANSPLAQDLLTKFSDTVVQGGSHSKGEELIDLCKDSGDSPTEKRNRPGDDPEFGHPACPGVLKKHIKIEKA